LLLKFECQAKTKLKSSTALYKFSAPSASTCPQISMRLLWDFPYREGRTLSPSFLGGVEWCSSIYRNDCRQSWLDYDLRSTSSHYPAFSSSTLNLHCSWSPQNRQHTQSRLLAPGTALAGSIISKLCCLEPLLGYRSVQQLMAHSVKHLPWYHGRDLLPSLG